MAFNKTRYKQLNKYMTLLLENRPWCSKCECPFEWAGNYLEMIDDCNKREDYEGSKAIKDAVIEFVNQYLPEGEKVKVTDLIRTKAKPTA